MHGIRSNPRRCMRGGVLRFTPANLGTVGLYNNSTGPELLVLWYLSWSTQNGLAVMGIQRGIVGTAQSTIAPLVTGETIYAGQVTKGDTATAVNADLMPYFPSYESTTLHPTLPWAILQPGWSFLIQDNTTGDAMNASFIWQSIHSEDLYGLPCPICWPLEYSMS